MSDSDEERINLLDIATGPIKHYNYDGSFFVKAEKVTAETEGYPPDEWDAIMSQDSQNRQRPPVTTPPDGEPSDRVLYKPIKGDYEIRVLEIKPGSGNETLGGTLHHCSVDGDRVTLGVCYTALSYTWVRSLQDALDPKFDQYFASFPAVTIDECMNYQYTPNEGPFFPEGAEKGLGLAYRLPTDNYKAPELNPKVKLAGNPVPAGGWEQRHGTLKELLAAARELTDDEIG